LQAFLSRVNCDNLLTERLKLVRSLKASLGTPDEASASQNLSSLQAIIDASGCLKQVCEAIGDEIPPFPIDVMRRTGNLTMHDLKSLLQWELG